MLKNSKEIENIHVKITGSKDTEKEFDAISMVVVYVTPEEKSMVVGSIGAFNTKAIKLYKNLGLKKVASSLDCMEKELIDGKEPDLEPDLDKLLGKTCIIEAMAKAVEKAIRENTEEEE